MISPISAALVSGITSDVVSEKGIVSQRLTETTFVITLPSGNLTVEVPRDSLSPGQTVAVNSHGDTVTIEQIPLDAVVRAPIDDTAELQQGRYFNELLSLLKQVGSAGSSAGQGADLAKVVAEIITVVESGAWNASSVAQYVALLRNALSSQLPMLQTYPDKVVAGRIQELLEVLSASPSSFVKSTGEQPAVVQSAVIPLADSPMPGFYYMQNSGDAKQLLQPFLIEGEGLQTLVSATDDKPLFIRFFPSEQGGGMRAAVLPLEKAIIEIEHMLRFEMKSPLLQRLDPFIVADAIAQKGSCSLDAIRKLDELLAGVPLEKTGAGQSTVLSKEALELTLPQVATLVLDTEGKLHTDMRPSLTRTMHQLPDVLTKITALLETDKQVKDLSEIKKIITESLQPGYIASERKNDLIPLLIKSMGYCLEHDIATLYSQSSASSTMKDIPSLKQALLYMLELCDTILSTEKATQDGVEKNTDGRTGLLRMPVNDSVEKSGVMPRDDTTGENDPGRVSRTPIEGMRQQIEQVLNRLESLQLLARQTTSTQGEQQIIVVPIHIGEEFTELRLAFNKKDSKKKKGKPSEQFKVQINMDLTSLGSIDAIMNYHLKKELTISLTIGSESARSWFQKNSNEVVTSLQSLGFPAVHISVRGPVACPVPKAHFIKKTDAGQSRFDTQA